MPFPSLAYRIILLVLLPCMAAAVYFEGRKYDHALIDFKPAVALGPTRSGSSPSSPALASPTSAVEGFQLLRKVREYTKENLYEHVNGHAEYFISAGFVKLSVFEYVVAGSQASQAELQAELYDMGKAIQAFGVLVDESGDAPAAVQVGAMGFKTSNGVNFIKGRYYIKISAFSKKAPVLKLAKNLEAGINASQDSFSISSKFPDMGKVVITRFIKEGYRGLDFLRNVVEREYSISGKAVKVALFSGDKSEGPKLLSAFAGYFEKSDIKIAKTERDGSDIYKVSDKYEGDWLLISSKDGLFGVFGSTDEDVLNHVIRKR